MLFSHLINTISGGSRVFVNSKLKSLCTGLTGFYILCGYEDHGGENFVSELEILFAIK